MPKEGSSSIFVPPPSIFQDDQKGGWQKMMKVFRSREFIAVCLGTIFLTSATALCLFISYPFFSLLITILTVGTCFLIFATFVFAQTSFLDGFFAILGAGYLFVGFFLIVSKSLVLGLIPVRTSVVEVGDAFLQIETYIRVVELASWIIGLCLAHRSFRGWKLLFGYLSVVFVFSVFVFLGIFYWGVFPTTAARRINDDGTVSATYSATVFRQVCAALWPPWFAAVIALLIYRRKHFSESVVVFLFFALCLRIINLILNAILKDLEQGPLDALQLLTRLASFLFIYLSVGTSVLRDPMKTLFYSLNLKQEALKNQSLVVSWMIDQVPSICILLDEEGVVGHVNKFATQKLKCNPREPLINSSFLHFLQFNSEEEKSKFNKEFRDLVKERIPTNFVVVKSKGTQVESDRVIEWTFKMVKSTMPIQSSSTSERNSASDIEMASFSKKSSSHGDISDTLSDDAQISVLCLGRDITDEIEREKFLTEARNNAERLALMQENFVANTSHELRTPLNCIVGVTDLLLMQNFNESDTEMITMIKTSANSLLALINDLLEFAKLKQGKMKLTYGPVNLRTFVETCVSSMSILYEKGNIDFCYWIGRDCPESIQTDDNRVRQILFNLLSNAVKFTPKGHIILTAKAIRMEGKETVIQFRVLDSGIGISPEDLQNLFLRFFQVERHIADRKPGTGIGLSISKQLVELMGGSINVSSQLGVGTVFTFSVPAGAISQFQANAERNFRGSQPPIDYSDVYTTTKQLVYVCLKNGAISSIIAEATRKDYNFDCVSIDEISSLNRSIESLNELQPSVPHSEGERESSLSFLTLIVEPLDLPQLGLEVLRSLMNKGVSVQIVLAIPASAPNLKDSSDPQLKDFKIAFIRKPFSIARIAHTIRTVEPPANRPHRPPSFDSLSKRSRTSSVSSHSSTSFQRNMARGRNIRSSLTGVKTTNPPSNHSVSSIHSSNTPRVSQDSIRTGNHTKASPDGKVDPPVHHISEFPVSPLITDSALNSTATFPKPDSLTSVQNSSTFTASVSPLHTGQTPELSFSPPPLNESPVVIIPTVSPPVTFQPLSFTTGAFPSFTVPKPIEFSAAPRIGTPSPTNVPTALFNPAPRSSSPVKDLSKEATKTSNSPKVATTSSVRDLRILIVEDDKTNQKVLMLMLKRIPGVVYQIAENGKEGVEKFLESHEKNLPYDCIFMDSQMPVMDGESATSEIRRIEMERPEIGHTHVTALTANALMDEKNQLFRTLVDDYLTKPITFITFSNKLQCLRDLLTPLIPIDDDDEIFSDHDSDSEGVIGEEPN